MKLLFFVFVFFISCSESGSMSTNNTLNVFMWADYISPEILSDFEKETGIKVNLENFANNEDMYSKLALVKNYYDLITPTEYMLSRMYDEGLIENLDFSKLKNPQEYTIDLLKELDEYKYSVPYVWGTIGILYDSDKINRPITSMKELFNEEFKDNVIMLDVPVENFAAALITLGYDINTTNPAQLKEAKDLLFKQKNTVNPLYYGDLNDETMIQGEGIISLGFSGDSINATRIKKSLVYVLPDEGANLWVDSLAMLKDSPNKENAYKFIDYLSRPEVAIKTYRDLGHLVANKELYQRMSTEDRNNPNVYPFGTNKKLFQHKYLGKDNVGLHDNMWIEIIGQ